MKKLILLFALIASFEAIAQDQTPIVVNVRDNAKLQFNGAAVKMKATVVSYIPVNETSKNFTITVAVQLYENNAGAYGSLITSVIAADGTLSEEEKTELLQRYADKTITYSTTGKYTDVNGNLVSSSTPGAIPEIQYWQSFKLNHASLNMTSASTQGALDAEYKIIQAIVAKLNTRKNF